VPNVTVSTTSIFLCISNTNIVNSVMDRSFGDVVSSKTLPETIANNTTMG